MSNIPINGDSHIYLYAKGWYKRTNTMNDLRKIYARRNGCDEKDITDTDILGLLCDLVHPYIAKNEYLLSSAIGNAFSVRGRLLRKASNTTTKSKLALQFLSILANLKIKELSPDGSCYKILLPLDEPDYTILPRRVE